MNDVINFIVKENQRMNTYNDLTINIPAEAYIRLNRASREYDMCINDIYYFILNGGKLDDKLFSTLFEDAFEKFYAYSSNKDIISNEYVIPAVRDEYNAADKLINNYWSINFDGSYKCTITNITIKPNTEEVIYKETIDDKWVEDIGYLHSKIEIYDQIINKLITVIHNGISQSVFDEYQKLRNLSVEASIAEDENRAKLLEEVVKPIIAEGNPKDYTWNLNPVEKTLTITRNNA